MSKPDVGRDKLRDALDARSSGAAGEMHEAGRRLIETSTLRRWLPLGLVVAAMGAAFVLGWHHHLTLESLIGNRDALKAVVAQHTIIAVLVYMIVYIGVVALSLPGAGALSVAGGLLFGVWIATPATVIAATVGATIIFSIARTSIGRTLLKNAGPWLDKFRKGFEKEGLAYMLFLRLVPFPFWIINLAPALLGVPLRTFVIGTLFGIIPGTIAFVYLGDTLDRIIEGGKAGYAACAAEKAAATCELGFELSQLPIRQILLALTVMGIVSLVPTLLRKWRARHAAD